MCVDSRAINMIIVKHRFPIMRLEDVPDCLARSSQLSKIDLQNGYHQVCASLRMNGKLLLKTQDALFESCIFMRLISHVLQPFLGKF